MIRWQSIPDPEPEPSANEILTNRAIFGLSEWLSEVEVTDGDRDNFFKLEYVGFSLLYSVIRKLIGRGVCRT